MSWVSKPSHQAQVGGSGPPPHITDGGQTTPCENRGPISYKNRQFLLRRQRSFGPEDVLWICGGIIHLLWSDPMGRQHLSQKQKTTGLTGEVSPVTPVVPGGVSWTKVGDRKGEEIPCRPPWHPCTAPSLTDCSTHPSCLPPWDSTTNTNLLTSVSLDVIALLMVMLHSIVIVQYHFSNRDLQWCEFVTKTCTIYLFIRFTVCPVCCVQYCILLFV